MTQHILLLGSNTCKYLLLGMPLPVCFQLSHSAVLIVDRSETLTLSGVWFITSTDVSAECHPGLGCVTVTLFATYDCWETAGQQQWFSCLYCHSRQVVFNGNFKLQD